MIRHMFFLVGFSLLVTTPALAHSPLKTTTPADGATLEAAPEKVELAFRGKVVLTALSISRAGEAVPIDHELDKEPASSFSVPLPELEPGDYVVFWRTLSEGDGHVASGRLNFTVAAQ